MNSNKYIKWFADLKNEGTALDIAGGKGANLSLLWNEGFPVPDGFIVSAETFKTYTERTDIRPQIEQLLSPQNLNVDDSIQLEKVSQTLEKLVKSTPIPKDMVLAIKNAYGTLSQLTSIVIDDEKKENEELAKFVAVRSTATAEDLPEASFAGQHDSFINIIGADKVVANVQNCWASLYTTRAIFYRVKHHFDHMKVNIAAVVQLMVNSEKAGVMFTANPTNEDLNTIMIEAVYGLGDYLVGGNVNPDSSLVKKNNTEIMTKTVKPQYVGLYRNLDYMKDQSDDFSLDSTAAEMHINKYTESKFNKECKIPLAMQTNQVLTDFEIRCLTHVGISIEKFYNCPQDIEWAYDGELYITQARNITTLKASSQQQVKSTFNKFPGSTLSKTTFSIDRIDEKLLLIGETASPGIVSGKVRVVSTRSDLEDVQKGDIIVADMTTPDWVPIMVKTGGIITDRGGITCHAAIVSREMGLPCIVGTNKGTVVLKEFEGKVITMDSYRGRIFEGMVEINTVDVSEEMVSADEFAASESSSLRLPLTNKNLPKTLRTKIKLIVDLPQYATEALSAVGGVDKIDGVGLVRMEMIIATGGVHPAEYLRKGRICRYIKLLKDGIRKIAEAMEGRPVWIRTSDLRSDEYRGLKGGALEPVEHDPMLGWHGIRRLIDQPDLMRAEFIAISDIFREGYNVGIMIPFIINLDELRYAKNIMKKDIGLEPVHEIEFGIMVETPGACWIIEELCKEGISFISFGTNDLTQLSLGLDRNNEKLGKHFNEMHPAILGQMKKVLDMCHTHNVETSICGQAGSKEAMAKFLVENHITSISINGDAYERIWEAITMAEENLHKSN